MAVEQRLVSPTATDPVAEDRNWSLRPRSMDHYVGQSDLIERLRITIGAARGRAEPMEHVLLHGPPGLGKTTLAHVIAAEMGTKVHTTSGPALSRGTDLVGALTRLEPGDILFIDEIHRLPIAVEEFVYPAMEDFRIDVPVDSGLSARTVQISLKPFTLIGATTRAGLVSAPLRSRFGLAYHLEYYPTDDLLCILERSCALLEVHADRDALRMIAGRSRGTPRIANNVLRWVRNFSDQRSDGRITADSTAAALQLERIDDRGLDRLDHAYLRCIAETYNGGPVGLEAVAATLNQDAGTLEDAVEPFLLQIGFLARTRRGRMLTRAAADHLGLSPDTMPLSAPADAMLDAE